jgi:hypothetical protein
MNKRILIAAISLVLTGPTYAAIIAYNDEDAKQDDNWYLAGERAPDQTRILSSGGIVRIWHTDSANFFGLPPIPMPHLTCITITDKERRVKASIYIKDGVNRWIKGEQYLLKLRNVAEARTVSKWWWQNRASETDFDGSIHAQWRYYMDDTKLPESYGDHPYMPPVDQIHLLVEVNEDPGRVSMIFVNADNGGLALVKESGYYSSTIRLPLDK